MQRNLSLKLQMERKLGLLQCDASDSSIPSPPPSLKASPPSLGFLAETSGGGKTFLLYNAFNEFAEFTECSHFVLGHGKSKTNLPDFRWWLRKQDIANHKFKKPSFYKRGPVYVGLECGTRKKEEWKVWSLREPVRTNSFHWIWWSSFDVENLEMMRKGS